MTSSKFGGSFWAPLRHAWGVREILIASGFAEPARADASLGLELWALTTVAPVFSITCGMPNQIPRVEELNA